MTLIAMPDGRRLRVRVAGPEDGPALVYFHGTPQAGTRLGAIDEAAFARGLRIISPTRAGYGDSDRDPGRCVVSVIADTEAVLDALGVERCLVAGWSGGGPHALACAARLKRAAGTLVIAGVAPADGDGLDFLAGMGQDNIDEFGAAFDGADALRGYLEQQRHGLLEANARGMVRLMRSVLPEVDQAQFTQTVGEELIASMKTGVKSGVEGWLDDDLAFVKPWGFECSEIAGPVSLWQGDLDRMVPFAHGQWLAGAIPGVRAHLLAGEGHLSIGFGQIDAMLDELIAIAD